ncbi:MAG TPA: hypothetical protein VFJ68_09215 [Casimicrobiaceae bacterium]|nr:hypothetical protein [Casimicrobiaceae bacterium]
MKKLLIAMCVAAIAPLAYGQYTAPATPEAAKAPPATGAAPDQSATAADQGALTSKGASESNAKRILGERNCVQHTGSNIVRKDKDTCLNVTGQAYGETAIERTGTFDTGVALERLSPSIQVRPGR